MTAPALRIEGLSVPFGREPGLESVSFGVIPGEILVLLGPSGAGKTSLLRAVAGLARCDGGRIEVAGREVGRLPPERRGVVYLHQNPLLFPHLSVAENVAFPLRVRRLGESDVTRRSMEAMRALQIDGLAHRRPATLSGGQRHRAALARAIVARPGVLLLDEPLAALDPVLRHDVREALVEAQQAYHPALVLVTHDLDEAGAMAHRVGVLLSGRLAQVATPAELFSRPATLAVARFLGFANEIPGSVSEEGCFRAADMPFTLPAAKCSPGSALALCPSEGLSVEADGPLAGRVVGVRHRAFRCVVLVQSGRLTLEASVDPLSPPARGSTVHLTWDPRRAVVFEAGR